MLRYKIPAKGYIFTYFHCVGVNLTYTCLFVKLVELNILTERKSEACKIELLQNVSFLYPKIKKYLQNLIALIR